MEFLKSDLFETEEKSRGKIRRVSSCRLKFTKNCFLVERFSEKCFTFDEVYLEGSVNGCFFLMGKTEQ